VLIDAFSHAAVDYPDARLVFMGEGETRAKLEKAVEVQGLGERACFAGSVTDAARYLPAYDIFVMPSRAEALGYALLEAGAASLPSVGARVGGIPEILEDGMTGLLVPPDDFHALANALQKLMADPTLRARLGAALHEKVASEFTSEKMIAGTFALYT
jgi:glycosyltransferase involved in cell wall biosynthesis